MEIFKYGAQDGDSFSCAPYTFIKLTPSTGEMRGGGGR